MSQTPMDTWPLLRRLVAECLRFRGRLALTAVSAATLGLAQLYFTWLVRRWVDGPLMTGDRRALATTLMEAGLVMVVIVLAMTTSRYLVTDVNQQLVASLRRRALDRLLHLDMTSVRKRHTGEVVARFINDAWQLSGFSRQSYGAPFAR